MPGNYVQKKVRTLASYVAVDQGRIRLLDLACHFANERQPHSVQTAVDLIPKSTVSLVTRVFSVASGTMTAIAYTRKAGH